MNVLAADIISIFEYVEAENRFLLPYDQAGRLLVHKVVLELEAHTGPKQLLEFKKDFYFTEDSINDPIMNSPNRVSKDEKSFVEREKV